MQVVFSGARKGAKKKQTGKNKIMTIILITSNRTNGLHASEPQSHFPSRQPQVQDTKIPPQGISSGLRRKLKTHPSEFQHVPNR